MTQQSIPRRIFDFLTEHWILNAIVLSIPSELFAAIQIAGSDLGLVDSKGGLSSFGVALFWPTLVVSFGFVMLKSRASRYDDRAKNNGQFVLQRVLDGVNAATTKKLNRFSEYIGGGGSAFGRCPFDIITQPKAQIEHILENIVVALSEISGIARGDIGVSLVYRLQNKDWQWLYVMNTAQDLSLTDVLKDRKSALRCVIDGTEKMLFFADKRDALALGKYVAGPRDLSNKCVGSVVCRDIGIENPDEMRAILSITTYGSQLCETRNQVSRQLIEDLLLPAFESRLRLELALFYIKGELARTGRPCVVR